MTTTTAPLTKGSTMRLDHTNCLHDSTAADRAACRRLIARLETQGFRIDQGCDRDGTPTGEYLLMLIAADEDENDIWLNTFYSPHHAATAALEIIAEELNAEA